MVEMIVYSYDGKEVVSMSYPDYGDYVYDTNNTAKVQYFFIKKGDTFTPIVPKIPIKEFCDGYKYLSQAKVCIVII